MKYVKNISRFASNRGFMNSAPPSEISQHKIILLTNRKRIGLIASFLKDCTFSHTWTIITWTAYIYLVSGWVLRAGRCEWRKGCLLGWISQMFAHLVTMRSQCYWFWCWLTCCIFRKIQYEDWFMVNDQSMQIRPSQLLNS